MSQLNSKRVAVVALAVIVVGVIVWLLFVRITAAEPLTVEQATNKVESLYNGKVVHVRELKNQIVIEMELPSGIYEIIVDRETGKIGHLTLSNNQLNNEVEKEPQQGNPSTQTPQTDAPNPVPATDNQNQLISEEEAKAIALQQINGVVDELKTKEIDGVIYYFVEVEQQDSEEGTVQIHGLTGDVVSITWDD